MEETKKKSFIVYFDRRTMLEALSYEQLGKLFLALCDFAECGKTNILLDGETKIAYLSLTPQMERDKINYENICARNQANGKLGGRPKKNAEKAQINPKKPSGYFDNLKNPTKPDNDIDNDIDNDTKSNNTANKLPKNAFNDEFEGLWKIYPIKKGKDRARLFYIKARKDGTNYETIANGLDRYIKQIQFQKTEPKYIKHGSTWFSQSAWEDDYTTNNITINNKNSDLDGIF